MNYFFGFIGKLIPGRGVWNNQEEINDPPVGHQNNPRETISSDCNPNTSDEQVLLELLTTSYVDPLSSNFSENANTYADAVSVPSIQWIESRSPVSVLDTEPNQVYSQVAKEGSSCTDHLIQQPTSRSPVGDDSSKEKLTSPEKTITEPGSTPKECKKKSPRRKHKAIKLSLMNSQNGQHNTTSQGSGNYVIASSSKGSSENRHELTEPISSPMLFGSQKQKLVKLKGTSPIDINPKDSKRWVVKEKFGSTKKACLVDETPNAEVALDRSSSVYIQSEEQESLCIPNSAEGTNGFQKPIVFESVLYSHNDDSFKGNLRCPSNAIIESVSPPVKSKKKASKQERKAMIPSSLNNQKNQITVDISSTSSQLNSSKSCSAVIYDHDSFLEDLICTQGTSTEPASRLAKSKKKASKQQRKEMKIRLLNTKNGKLTGEPSTISHADLLSSNSVAPISSNANDVSEPRGQLQESSENGCILTEKDSLPTSYGSLHLVAEMINYDDDDDGDSAKEKLKCKENRITESDPKQTRSTKSALCRQRRKAKKLGLLTIQDDQLIGESSTSSHSDPLSSISVEQIISNANAVNVPSGHEIGENGHVWVDFNSPTSVLDLKPILANPQMAKEESGCADHLILIQKSYYTKSSLGTSCLVNGSTYALLDKTTGSGYLQPKEQESLEKNNGSCDSLETGSIVYLRNDGSLKEKLSYTDATITEPDSTPVKSKKKTSKKQIKAMKMTLLNNQNKHLTGESLKTSHSEPVGSKFIELVSAGVNDISVSSNNNEMSLWGHRQVSVLKVPVENNSYKVSATRFSSNALDSQKRETSSCAPQKVTLETSTKKKKALAKEESSSSKTCLVNESTKRQRQSGSGISLAPKTQLILQKTTSVIDLKQNDIKIRASKKNSSWINSLFSIIFVDGSNTPCLINRSTYETAFSQSGFAIALEQEYRYVCNSVSINNGSHLLDKASTSPTSETKIVKRKRKIQGYDSSHKILLVGEGNFSFSSCIARAFNSAPNLVATSLNSEAYLECNYKEAMKNISELRMRGCKVLHDVDATTMANHSSLACVSYDRIIYNFPHCGDFSPTESGLRKNQRLVRLFLENSIKMIEKDGEIHIRHKLTPFFSKWNVKGLASEVGLVLIDEAPFDINKFEGYTTKYGFSRRTKSSDANFCCDPSCTYKFALPGHQSKLETSELNR